ncbi:MAG: DNA topoisomerase I [Chloroflexi bacterium UTCFX4]|nr:MAG: DNA topoisomerase I [Chloroflexi bacterium UTCFX4]
MQPALPLVESRQEKTVARETKASDEKSRVKKSIAPKRATRSRRARSEDDDLGEESISNLQFPISTSGAALVIVESPAKAKTISKFLGRNYRVRASVGHIRDLPRKDLGVDLEHDFKPKYEITAKKRDVVDELREYAQSAREIYLATDPDREGEAISWHLAAVLKNQIAGKPVHRVEFHEITQDAIRRAFSHPRELDMGRVDAQQARRVLDRIVGYTISPLLAKKMKKWTLSAGRVQSVAVRLVVEREREIQNFVAVEYWSIEAELEKQGNTETGKQGESISNLHSPFSPFRARLVQVGDKDFECHSGAEALKLKEVLEKCNYRVLDARRKDVTRNPYPPYITSSLQQDASRRLGFNPKRTMKVAQELYEGIDVGEEAAVGLITYMRTDSTNVAEAAQKEALEYIEQKFGANYLPPKPRVYAKKVAGAQEAHEAIRPTKTFREPNALRQYLDNDGRNVGDEDEENDSDKRLPPLEKNEPLALLGIYPEQHFTEPPPRYTEATLIKALEQHGIGRPSTYAPIMANIQERDYIEQIQGRRLKPTELGFVVNDLLVAHFAEIVDLGFTAQLEEKLDAVAEGKENWTKLMREFYGPFKETLDRAAQEMPITIVADEKTDVLCDLCGAPMVIKKAKYGKFLSCSRFPACKGIKKITTGVQCPKCKEGELREKKSKKGRVFYGCARYPNCDFASWDKPLSEPCPNCGGLLTQSSKNMIRCVNGDYSRGSVTAR